MSLHVYIAASSREVERVRAAQEAARQRGWVLTLDWLAPLLANLAAGAPDAVLSDEEAALHARADLEAVERADVFWYLCPTQSTRGAYVELGFALASGIAIVCSGQRTSVFEASGAAPYGGRMRRVETDPDAVAHIEQLEREWAGRV